MHQTGEAFFRTEPLRWEDKDALYSCVFVWFFDSLGVRSCAMVGRRLQREALLDVGVQTGLVWFLDGNQPLHLNCEGLCIGFAFVVLHFCYP